MSLLGRWRIVEMPDYTEAQGDGAAELQPDGSLKGQICFHLGNDANFIARRETSSTAC